MGFEQVCLPHVWLATPLPRSLSRKGRGKVIAVYLALRGISTKSPLSLGPSPVGGEGRRSRWHASLRGILTKRPSPSVSLPPGERKGDGGVFIFARHFIKAPSLPRSLSRKGRGKVIAVYLALRGISTRLRQPLPLDGGGVGERVNARGDDKPPKSRATMLVYLCSSVEKASTHWRPFIAPMRARRSRIGRANHGRNQYRGP